MFMLHSSRQAYSWFQTFAVFWMLYAFFWVVPRRLNFRRRGTTLKKHTTGRHILFIPGRFQHSPRVFACESIPSCCGISVEEIHLSPAAMGSGTFHAYYLTPAKLSCKLQTPDLKCVLHVWFHIFWQATAVKALDGSNAAASRARVSSIAQ